MKGLGIGVNKDKYLAAAVPGVALSYGLLYNWYDDVAWAATEKGAWAYPNGDSGLPI